VPPVSLLNIVGSSVPIELSNDQAVGIIAALERGTSLFRLPQPDGSEIVVPSSAIASIVLRPISVGDRAGTGPGAREPLDLGTVIEDVEGLSIRSLNVLKANGMTTLGLLLNRSQDEVFDILVHSYMKNVRADEDEGREYYEGKCRDELDAVVTHSGRHFRPRLPHPDV
jgi:hypothetical protein